MRSRILFIATCACLLAVSGCSTRPPEASPYQQTLLTRCPETLPTLSDGEAGTVLRTMTEWASQYHDCATRHNGLIEAIRE